MRMWTEEGFRSTVELNSYRIFFVVVLHEWNGVKKMGRLLKKKKNRQRPHFTWLFHTK
jgi:hypothetical protein